MSSVHLLVLIHGMWGNPAHVAELHRIMKETHGGSPATQRLIETDDHTELEVLLAETNRDESTYDGIDWGGERVAEEVYDAVSRLEKDGKQVTRMSVTGYSLGGLVARYMIGILHQRRFFDQVKPVNLNTFATPHIGLLRYSSWGSSLLSSLGPILLSRTGEQLYGVDKWSARGRPLLDVMADPNRIFYQALASFENVTIYANAVNDLTVPYVTACIESEDPFIDHELNGIEIQFDEKYKALIKSYTLPSTPLPRSEPELFSSAWFASLNPRRFMLPPFLQFRFPLNIVFYLLSPILIPFFFIALMIRLLSAARSSRARIQLLEKDESYRSKLIHVLQDMEREAEETMDELTEDADDTESRSLETAEQHPRGQPILTPAQRTRIASLNRLPGLKKERAFIHPVRNSHGSLICRDVKNFTFHRKGEGVLRHWADHFVL